MKKFLYKSIFVYSSLQFCGHVEEYFVQNSEKLVVYVVMPRLKNKFNLLRIYKEGKLVEEKRVLSSENIFLYYLSWYFHYLYFIFKYFSRNEKFYVFTGHPISLFGMSLQKLFRPNIKYAYWIGDYFPKKGILLRAYEWIKKYYNDKVSFACYLSDNINKVMNGKVVNQANRKTVMWGVRPIKIKRSIDNNTFVILFIGLIKDSQGLEFLLHFLQEHSVYKLNIIGICDQRLYNKYQSLIKEYKIQNQVFFPNRFFTDDELIDIAKTCHVGIALYNTDKDNPTYYTDPGKVKAYAELRLPIIMSNVSSIAAYIKKFGCGEVIVREDKELAEALLKIKNNYRSYMNGLKKFNEYFYYESYYDKGFKFLKSKLL